MCPWLTGSSRLYVLQSSSADGIAVVAVCCQSMSSVQYNYVCNSTEASAPLPIGDSLLIGRKFASIDFLITNFYESS